jgi:hypothetical protein
VHADFEVEQQLAGIDLPLRVAGAHRKFIAGGSDAQAAKRQLGGKRLAQATQRAEDLAPWNLRLTQAVGGAQYDHILKREPVFAVPAATG